MVKLFLGGEETSRLRASGLAIARRLRYESGVDDKANEEAPNAH